MFCVLEPLYFPIFFRKLEKKKKRRNHKWSDQTEPEQNTQKEEKQALSEDLKCSEETYVYTKLSGGVRTHSVILITDNDGTPFSGITQQFCCSLITSMDCCVNSQCMYPDSASDE